MTDLYKNLLFIAITIAGCSSSSSTENESTDTVDNTEYNQSGVYKFIAFGDFNGGGCERMNLVTKNIAKMAAEPDIAFYISTGDIIDGYVDDAGTGTTTCFADDPSTNTNVLASACPGDINNGNMAEVVAPIKNRLPVEGLVSSYYPVIGNHDDNWGSNWYPSPCNDGICDFLNPLIPSDFIKHSHGNICSLDQDSSSHSSDFYYSFTFRNSRFIVLRENDDYYSSISGCNNLPSEYDKCSDYCTDPTLRNDSGRNSNCYSVSRYDWLVDELTSAQNNVSIDHIFLFSHAVMLGSGENHTGMAGADKFRALYDQYSKVRMHINGHNHGYERTHKVKGGDRLGIGAIQDSNGVMYLTTGTAGASYDGVTGGSFTAAKWPDWTTYGNWEEIVTYTIFTIDAGSITGETKSLGIPDNPVDTFTVN